MSMKIEKALQCSELVYFSYLDQTEETKQRILDLGYTDVKFFDKDGAEAVVAHNGTEIFVAYRGTELSDFHDMVYNFSIWPRYGEKQGKVHTGFAVATSMLWKDISYYLDAQVMSHKGMDKNVYFTGHSQGGAMAIISAARSKYVAHVYTMGSPRMCNREYAKNIKSRVYRFTYENDLIPRIIPPGFYWHIGTEYRLTGSKIIEIKSVRQAVRLWWWILLKKAVKLRLIDSFLSDHNRRQYALAIRYNQPDNF